MDEPLTPTDQDAAAITDLQNKVQAVLDGLLTATDETDDVVRVRKPGLMNCIIVWIYTHYYTFLPTRNIENNELLITNVFID